MDQNKEMRASDYIASLGLPPPPDADESAKIILDLIAVARDAEVLVDHLDGMGNGMAGGVNYEIVKMLDAKLATLRKLPAPLNSPASADAALRAEHALRHIIDDFNTAREIINKRNTEAHNAGLRSLAAREAAADAVGEVTGIRLGVPFTAEERILPTDLVFTKGAPQPSLQAILNCYSPDDTVGDYQDKIRALFNPAACYDNASGVHSTGHVDIDKNSIMPLTSYTACFLDPVAGADTGSAAEAKEAVIEHPAEIDPTDPRDHVLYTNADADRPEAICDANGDVVLGLCKVCGMGEVELSNDCPGKRAERDDDGDLLPPGAKKIQCCCQPGSNCFQRDDGTIACEEPKASDYDANF